MEKKRGKSYTFDPEPYRELVQEFLLYASIDVSYACAIARAARTLQTKRAKFQA